MQVVFGIDLTQDGSRVIGELISFNMTDSELSILIDMMNNEHDEVYVLEIDQNSQLAIDAITKGKNFTKSC